jgi:DivIVA domain-containing protein
VVVVEIFLIAVVVFGVAAVAMGFGGSMTRFAPDWPGRSLPDGRAVGPDDIEAARFSLAFRGYRMSEVDLTLDRLAGEIAERDSLIEQLTGSPYQRPDAELAADQTQGAEPVPVDGPPDGADTQTRDADTDANWAPESWAREPAPTIEMPAVASWPDDETRPDAD